MSRRRALALFSGTFVVCLLLAGLAASLFDLGGSFRISPRITMPTEPAAPAAPGPTVTPAAFRAAARRQGAGRAGGSAVRRSLRSCHGADLEGEANWRQRKPDGKLPAPAHDETGHTWHHPDGMLFAITRFGTRKITGLDSDMPGFEGILEDDDIVAVLSFIKSTWPPEIRARHDQINQRIPTQ